MEIDEQTIVPAFVSNLATTVKNIINYVLCVIKLYLIGAVALLYQLLEKSAPVRGMHHRTFLLLLPLLLSVLSNHHVDYFVVIGGLHCEGAKKKKKKATGVLG